MLHVGQCDDDDDDIYIYIYICVCVCVCVVSNALLRSCTQRWQRVELGVRIVWRGGEGQLVVALVYAVRYCDGAN